MVREWLKILGLLGATTHEDRLAIDRKIEWITGVNCDESIQQGRITMEAFKKIVDRVLKARKLKKKLNAKPKKKDEKKKRKREEEIVAAA